MGVYHNDSVDNVPTIGKEDRKYESFFEWPVKEETPAQEAVQDEDEEDSDGSGTISSTYTASRISKTRRTGKSPARERKSEQENFREIDQNDFSMRWNQWYQMNILLD